MSSSRRSASRSGPSRQRIVGSLSPDAARVEADDVEAASDLGRRQRRREVGGGLDARGTRATGVDHERADALRRGGGRVAQHRDRAGPALRRPRSRAAPASARTAARGPRRSAGPPRWRRTARTAPTRAAGRRTPRARAGRSPRGRAPRRPGRPAHIPRAGRRRSPPRRRRGPSDDGGAGSRWIARRSPCHGPRDRPVTGFPGGTTGCPTSHCEAGPSGRPGRRGGASVGPATSRRPGDPPRSVGLEARTDDDDVTRFHSPAASPHPRAPPPGDEGARRAVADAHGLRREHGADLRRGGRARPARRRLRRQHRARLRHHRAGDHRGAADPHPRGGARRAARPRRRRPPLRQLPGLGRAGRRPPPSSS